MASTENTAFQEAKHLPDTAFPAVKRLSGGEMEARAG
jgi:hypothetical protein